MSFDEIKRDVNDKYFFFYHEEAKPQDVSEELHNILDLLVNKSTDEDIKKTLESYSKDKLNALKEMLDISLSSKDLSIENKKLLTTLYQKVLEAKTKTFRRIIGDKTASLSQPLSVKVSRLETKESKKSDEIIASLKEVSLDVWLTSFMVQFEHLEEDKKVDLLSSLTDEQLKFFEEKLKELSPQSILFTQITQLKVQKISSSIEGLPTSLKTIKAKTIDPKKAKGNIEVGGQSKIVEDKTKYPSILDSKVSHVWESLKECVQTLLMYISNKVTGFFYNILTSSQTQTTDLKIEKVASERLKEQSIDERKAIFSNLSSFGTQLVQDKLTQSQDGEKSVVQRDRQLTALFGQSLASSVKGYSENVNNSLQAIIPNLEERKQVLELLNQNSLAQEVNELKKDSVFFDPGAGSLATFYEQKNLDAILENEELQKKVGLGPSDIDKLKSYRDDLKRSEDLNSAFHAIRAKSGHLNDLNEDKPLGALLLSIKQRIDLLSSKPKSKKEKEFVKLLNLFVDHLRADFDPTQPILLSDLFHTLQTAFKDSFSQEIKNVFEDIKKVEASIHDKVESSEKEFSAFMAELQERVENLDEERAVFLDVAIEFHAMRLSIKKLNGEIVLTTYDSSGALDRLNKSYLELYFSGAYDKSPLTANAYQTRSSVKFFQEEGIKALRETLYLGTKEGMRAQLSRKPIIESSYIYTISPTKYQRILYRKDVYENYRKKFNRTSEQQIGSYLPLLQKPQVTNNCFAAKSITNQYYELGVSLFKKYRAAELFLNQQEIRDTFVGKLSEDGKGVQNGLFDKLEYRQRFLTEVVGVSSRKSRKSFEIGLSGIKTSDELNKIAKELAQLSQIPDKQYFLKYIQELNALKSSLNKGYLQTTDSEKKNTYLKAYLQVEGRLKNLETAFKKDLEDNFQQEKIDLYFNKDGSFTFDSEDALNEFCEFLTYTACKNIYELSNHNLNRLAMERRYLTDLSQRCPEVDPRDRKVPFQNLEEARVVTYAKGYFKNKVTAVELVIEGVNVEISPKAYFALIRTNPQALSSSKVTEIVQFLRAESQEIKASFDKELFGAQKQSMLTKTSEKINTLVQELGKEKAKIEKDLSDIEVQLKSLEAKELKLNEQMALLRDKDTKGSSQNYQTLLLLQEQTKLAKQEFESLKVVFLSKLEDLNEQVSFLTVGDRGSKGFLPKNVLAQMQNCSSKEFAEISSKYILLSEELDARKQLLKEQKEDLKSIREGFLLNFRKKIYENSAAILELSLRKNEQFNALFALKDLFELERSPLHSELTDKIKTQQQAFISKSFEVFQEVLEEDIIKKTSEDSAFYLAHSKSLLEGFNEESLIKYASSINPEELLQDSRDYLVDAFAQSVAPDDLLKILDEIKTQENPATGLKNLNLLFSQWLREKTKITSKSLKLSGLDVQIGLKDIETLESQREALNAQALSRGEAATKIAKFFKKQVAPKVEKKEIQIKEERVTEGPHLSSIKIDPVSQDQKAFLLPLINYEYFSKSSEIKDTSHTPLELLLASKNPLELPQENFIENSVDYLKYLSSNPQIEEQDKKITAHLSLLTQKILQNLSLLNSEQKSWYLEFCKIYIPQTLESFELLSTDSRKDKLTLLATNFLLENLDTKTNTLLLSLENKSKWLQIVAFLDNSFLYELNRSITLNVSEISSSNPWQESLQLSGTFLRHSSVGLDFVQDGKEALTEAIQNSELENSRFLSDKYDITCGDSLSTFEFIHFYSSMTFLNPEFLGSTSGKKRFEVLLSNIASKATEADKDKLKSFLKNIQAEVSKQEDSIDIANFFAKVYLQNASLLNIPKEEFSILLKSQLDKIALVFLENDATRSFIALIDSMTLIASTYAESLDKKLLFQYITQLAAYNLLKDEMSSSLVENLETSPEMASKMTQMQALHSKMQPFIFSLELNQDDKILFQESCDSLYRASLLEEEFKTTILSGTQVSSNVFQNERIAWDLDQGLLYVNGVRSSRLPAYIHELSDVKFLEIAKLTYKKEGDQFVNYSQGNPQIVIKSIDDKCLIYRNLPTSDSDTQMLQFMGIDAFSNLPQSVIKNFGVTTLWIGPEGKIYGFDDEFQLKVIFSKDENHDIVLKNVVDAKEYIIHPLEYFESNQTLKGLLKCVSHQDILITKDGLELTIASLNLRFLKEEENWVVVSDNHKGFRLINDEMAPGIFLEPPNSLVANKESLEREKEALDSLIASKQGKKSLKDIHELSQALIRREEISQTLQQSTAKILLLAPKSRENQQKLEKITQKIQEQKIIQETLFASYIKDPGNKDLLKEYEEASLIYKNLLKEYHGKAIVKSPLASYYIDHNLNVQPTDLASSLVLANFGEKSFEGISKHLLNKKFPLDKEEFKLIQEFIERNLQEDNEAVKQDPFTLMLVLAQIKSEIELRRLSLTTPSASRAFDPLLLNCRLELIQEASLSLFTPPLKNEKKILKEFAQTISSELSQDVQIRYFQEPFKSHEKVLSKTTLDLSKASFYPIEILGVSLEISCKFKLETIPPEQTQIELLEKIDTLSHDDKVAKESIEAQKKGYYEEEYGLVDQESLNRLFSVKTSSNKEEVLGVYRIDQKEVKSIFDWLEKEGVIKKSIVDGLYEQTGHPKDTLSLVGLQAFLMTMRFQPQEAIEIARLCELWLYKQASQQFTLHIDEAKAKEISQGVENNIEMHQIACLESKSVLEKLFHKQLDPQDFALIHAAYLQDDAKVYQTLFDTYGLENNEHNRLVLQNSVTRNLYNKTELDHLQDIQNQLKSKNFSKAASLLLTKRGFDVAKLLHSPSKVDLVDEKKLEEHKIVKAFLIFEATFGHRCNLSQAQIFRGLILSDKLSPEKINAAQARMGFGKTSLMPLIALARADGKKLVRYIVPKSALESNAEEMTKILSSAFGSKAVIDSFSRYKLGLNQSQIEFYDNVQKDLALRLKLYEDTKDSCKVLIQTPSVRNSLEDQLKIFLDSYKDMPESKEKEKLLACIELLGKIRGIETLSVFDELDATQDPLSTDVNYTSGEKMRVNPEIISSLKNILVFALSHKSMNKEELLNYFIKELSKGRLTESERSHLKEYISRNDFEPDDQILGKVSSTDILLLRAIFSNDIMMELLQEKQPGVDFGVWFENLEAGIKGYDTLEGENLLIAVPYGAANEPKPKGSRFDNTEVTIIATFKYLLSSVTEISKHPHIDFLVNAFKSNMSLEVLSDEERSTELIQSLIRISSIEDTASLGKAKVEFVEKYKDRLDELRIPLATLVCARQLSFDSYKASSNRTEQGNLDDEIIGFSGTSGDTSSFFKQVALDPLADAKVTFGIMARTNCQKTTVMVLGDDLKSRQYSKAVISKSLPFSGSDANKVFIDAGGYCKNSNRVIAEEILMHYEEMDKPLEGVVFYDDTTNTKTVLLRQDDKTFIQVPFDASYQKQVASKDSNFLTYYDQSHSRGADITQPDGCNAVITVSIGTSMNDFKQAALRMRKIVDCSSKQTFSLTFDEQFATKLTQELGDEAKDITTNDVAFWLRKQELKSDHDQVVGQFVQEMQAVAKNYILECIEKTVIAIEGMKENKEEAKGQLSKFIEEITKSYPLLEKTASELFQKYGNVSKEFAKRDFIAQVKSYTQLEMHSISELQQNFATLFGLAELVSLHDASNQKKRNELLDQVIERREKGLKDKFFTPTISSTMAHCEVVAEVSSVVSSQSQSQSQSQSISHTFSEIQNEEAAQCAPLDIIAKEYSKPALDFLKRQETLIESSTSKDFGLIFAKEDHVVMSPFYASNRNPTLQFALYDSDNHQFILINRDEAALFKQSIRDNESYLLINFRDPSSFDKIPEYLRKSQTFQKIAFANLRFEDFNSSDIKDIEAKLKGTFEASEFYPSLQYEQEGEYAPGLIDFKAWGNQSEISNSANVTINTTQGLNITLKTNSEPVELNLSERLKDSLKKFIPDQGVSELKDPSKGILQSFSDKQQENLQLLEEEKKELEINLLTAQTVRDSQLTSAKKTLGIIEKSIDVKKQQVRERLNRTFQSVIQAKITNQENAFLSEIDSKKIEEAERIKSEPVGNFISIPIKAFLVEQNVIIKDAELTLEESYEKLWKYCGENEAAFLGIIEKINKEKLLPVFPQVAAAEAYRNKSFKELLKEALRPYYENKGYAIGKSQKFKQFGEGISLEKIESLWAKFLGHYTLTITGSINSHIPRGTKLITDTVIDAAFENFEKESAQFIAERLAVLGKVYDDIFEKELKRISGAQLIINSTYGEIESASKLFTAAFIYEKQKESVAHFNYQKEEEMSELPESQAEDITALKGLFRALDKYFIEDMDPHTAQTASLSDDFLLKYKKELSKFIDNLDGLQERFKTDKQKFIKDLKALKESKEKISDIQNSYNQKKETLSAKKIGVNKSISQLRQDIKDFKQVFVFENNVMEEVSGIGLRLQETLDEDQESVDRRGLFLERNTHFIDIIRQENIQHQSKATILPPHYYQVDRCIRQNIYHALGYSKEESHNFAQIEEMKRTIKENSKIVRARDSVV